MSICRLVFGTAVVFAVTSLGVPSPGVAEPASKAPAPTVPAVDLAQMVVGDDVATAATRSGERVRLTIDPDLQRASDRLLAQADPVAGAIIAVDARTGRVLVWADRRRGRANPGTVLLTRQGPAASLFKIVTTTALFEHGKIHPQKRVCWSGGEHVIGRSQLDPPQHGPIQCAPFGHALGHSRNAVYAQLATNYLSRSDLIEATERFGFNTNVPFDVDVPMGRVSVPYDDLGFARTATGFENSTLSPLGALTLAYAVASGGYAVRLHVVDQAGDYRAPSRREVVGRVMDARTAANLRWMMEITIHSGTSLEAFSDESGRSYLGTIRAAGKTGTLQPKPGDPTTSWFVGFAPSRDPQIVVSVLMENGSIWRRRANEVARDVMRAYFAARRAPGVTPPFPE